EDALGGAPGLDGEAGEPGGLAVADRLPEGEVRGERGADELGLLSLDGEALLLERERAEPATDAGPFGPHLGRLEDEALGAFEVGGRVLGGLDGGGRGGLGRRLGLLPRREELEQEDAPPEEERENR